MSNSSPQDHIPNGVAIAVIVAIIIILLAIAVNTQR